MTNSDAILVLGTLPMSRGSAYHEAFEIARKAILDSEKQKWISVSERLPEKNVDVLIYNTEDYIGSDFLTAEGKWFWNEEYPPTHWKPLPEPPMED